MKRILATAFVLLFIMASAYAGTQDDKKIRDDFFTMAQKTLGFSKADCAEIRKAGFTPQFGLVFLYIARETGRPIPELLTLRSQQGYSMRDICDAYKVDYEKVAEMFRADVIKYKILFPAGTKQENKKTTTTIPRKKAGK